MNKKGLSPLIATVLLIAFAVALGAMIMNWSSGFEEQQPTQIDPCRDVRIELNEAFGKDILCYDEGFIKASVSNKGLKAISGIQLRVLTEDTTETNVDLKGSSMPLGGIFRTDYPFAVSGKTHVELVPKVDGAYCTSKSIVVDVLASCGN